MCIYDGFDILIQYYLNRGPRFLCYRNGNVLYNKKNHKCTRHNLTPSLNSKANCFHSRVHYKTRFISMSMLENGCGKTKKYSQTVLPLTQGKGWAMNFHLLILSLWISVPFSSEHCLKKRNYNLIRKRCTMHSTIYYPQHFWYVLGNCICKITKFWGRHGQTNAAHTVYSLYLYMNIIPILFLFTSEFSDGQLPLHL